MDNVGDGPVSIVCIPGGEDASDALSSTEIKEQKCQMLLFLAVNRSISNLVDLSDSHGSSEGFVKDGNEPSSFHYGGNKNTMDANVGPFFRARHMVDLECVEAYRDEHGTPM